MLWVEDGNGCGDREVEEGVRGIEKIEIKLKTNLAYQTHLTATSL